MIILISTMASTLFVIQPTPFCNLNCSYCYLPDRKNTKKIDDNLLQEIVAKIASYANYSDFSVSWHAGEPLVMGVEFYERAFELFRKNIPSNKGLLHSIQTNGTLINQGWVDLFKEYNVELGLSIDGPKFIHDKHRVSWSNKGSYAKVEKAINVLKANNMTLRAIAVLTSYSLDYPNEIFEYFLTQGFSTVGFNVEELEGFNANSSLISQHKDSKKQLERYKVFMRQLLVRWFEHKENLTVREFNQVIRKMIMLRKYNHNCGSNVNEPLKIITIDVEGYVYTYSPELASGISTNPRVFSIGHISSVANFDDFLKKPALKKLDMSIQKGIKVCESECQYFDVCQGGNPANKFYETNSFETAETVHCQLTTKAIVDIVNEYLYDDLLAQK